MPKNKSVSADERLLEYEGWIHVWVNACADASSGVGSPLAQHMIWCDLEKRAEQLVALGVPAKKLAAMRDAAHEAKYIPGNHNVYVFLLEAAKSQPWALTLVQRVPILSRIFDEVQDKLMSAVSSVHYPYLTYSKGDRSYLLTHGHYSSACWRLLGGRSNSEFPSVITALSAWTAALAHKHVRWIRRSINHWDSVTKVQAVEDNAILVTNAVVNAYRSALDEWRNNIAPFLDVQERAMEIYFGVQGDPLDAVAELEIREALLSIAKAPPARVEEDVEQVWKSNMQLIRARPSEECYEFALDSLTG